MKSLPNDLFPDNFISGLFKSSENNWPYDPKSIAVMSTFDQRHLFKIKSFLITGDNWRTLSAERKLCLGAQASIDKLFWILETVKNWSGPFSIAIFTPHYDYHISLKYIEYLRYCFPKVREQFSFHICFPHNHTIRENKHLHSIHVEDMACDQPRDVLQHFLAEGKRDTMPTERIKYPQNLLRNLAKQGCQTEFTFVPDIDMIPNPGMDLELEEFLSSAKVKKCVKCIFVVPNYEIHSNVTTMPRTKDELTKLYMEGLARPFHEEVYDNNQKASNLSRWIKIPTKEHMGVAYYVKKYVFLYEPIYVARANIPPFDERFIGYGMTRNTQVSVSI